jgi:hypothetical protein
MDKNELFRSLMRYEDIPLVDLLNVCDFGTESTFVLPVLVDYIRVKDDRNVWHTGLVSVGRILQRSEFAIINGADEVESESIRVAIEFLASLIRNSNIDLQHLALHSLGLSGCLAQSAVPSIVDLAIDTIDSKLRLRIFQALSWIGGATAEQFLSSFDVGTISKDTLEDWLRKPTVIH